MRFIPKRIDEQLKATVRRLEAHNEILKAATVSSPGNEAPEPLTIGFIDTMRAEGHAVEAICRVLHEQGSQVAARTYRSSRCSSRVIRAGFVCVSSVVAGS